jgi:hypothetical protein
MVVFQLSTGITNGLMVIMNGKTLTDDAMFMICLVD